MSKSIVPCALVACALVLAWPAWATEVTVQNDSLADGAQGAIQTGFVPGESAAAWLTSPCAGHIVAVQIFWRSYFGGAEQSLEDSISIFAAGTFPTPGALLANDYAPFQPAYFEGPVMSDGVLNEFRFLDEQSTIPLHVAVNAGQVFVVSFKFYNDPPAFGPSVVTDTNGCQANKNGVGLTNGTWSNLCGFGASGDFVIRAVIDCPGPSGACCHASGACETGVQQSACSSFGDVWTQGQTCAQVSCSPRGACCIGTGCLGLTTQAQCVQAGGAYAGNGTDCGSQVCVPGACCNPTTGVCSQQRGFQCTAGGGVFHGPNTSCSPNPCPQPTGACCVGTFCFGGQTLDQCNSVSGQWLGGETICGTPNPCEASPPCPGDTNCNGQVDFADINPFVDALLNSTYCDGTGANADVSNNGSVGFEDINPFVGLLTDNPLPIACP